MPYFTTSLRTNPVVFCWKKRRRKKSWCFPSCIRTGKNLSESLRSFNCAPFCWPEKTETCIFVFFQELPFMCSTGINNTYFFVCMSLDKGKSIPITVKHFTRRTALLYYSPSLSSFFSCYSTLRGNRCLKKEKKKKRKRKKRKKKKSAPGKVRHVKLTSCKLETWYFHTHTRMFPG